MTVGPYCAPCCEIPRAWCDTGPSRRTEPNSWPAVSAAGIRGPTTVPQRKEDLVFAAKSSNSGAPVPGAGDQLVHRSALQFIHRLAREGWHAILQWVHDGLR